MEHQSPHMPAASAADTGQGNPPEVQKPASSLLQLPIVPSADMTSPPNPATPISRPPSPAVSSLHLSISNAQGGTRAASILSRHPSRPASIQRVAATAAALMNNPEARRIRVDLYADLARGWLHLSTGSKILLAYYTGATVAEIVVTVTIAIIERETVYKCFYLLIFLALYLLRSIVICSSLLRRFLYVRPHDLPRSLSGACGAHYKTMINWASLVLLLFSVSLLTTQSHCAQDSPGLFYLVLIFSLLGYLCLAMLLLLWFLVVFCLNGLVVVLELFGVGPRVMQWQGATQDMLDDIPIVKYTKHDQNTLPSAPVQPPEPASTSLAEKGAETVAPPSIVVSEDSTGLQRLQSGEHGASPKSVTIDIEPTIKVEDGHRELSPTDPVSSTAGVREDEDSSNMLELEHLSSEEQESASRISTSCSICLCDYEDLEELRHLPCNHYFHKECVDEWLKLKRTCPLCKYDIARASRGSKMWTRRGSSSRGRHRRNGSESRRLSLGSRR
ncbi:hypothetical protein EDD21DRAFT_42590 [Dissophora ornata]|nr:hypothetical protein EDD21DRAFT_42590 [Dissophora ornata]